MTDHSFVDVGDRVWVKETDTVHVVAGFTNNELRPIVLRPVSGGPTWTPSINLYTLFLMNNTEAQKMSPVFYQVGFVNWLGGVS